MQFRQVCRSRGFWVKPEPVFLSGSDYYSYSSVNYVIFRGHFHCILIYCIFIFSRSEGVGVGAGICSEPEMSKMGGSGNPGIRNTRCSEVKWAEIFVYEYLTTATLCKELANCYYYHYYPMMESM